MNKNKYVSKTKAISRRTALKLGAVTSVWIPTEVLAQPPNRMRPQPGDQLVYGDGDFVGELIDPTSIILNQQPVPALARDPDSLLKRDGSRLNRLMITRIDQKKLSERHKENAAEGIVAFSAICTHTGCDITNWDAEKLAMACPCHESMFDIYNGGTVIGGPAPRPLAMLPLNISKGVLTVAASFRGRVGFTQQF
jgi:Rieske Fe-S protein